MELLITETDKAIFEKHISLYETATKSGFVKNFTQEIYRELLYLYMKYITPKHQFSHWCGDCRVLLVKQLYGWYIDTSIEKIHTSIESDITLPEEPVKKKRGRKPKSQ